MNIPDLCSTTDTAEIPIPPSADTQPPILTAADYRARRRTLGGRAQDRIGQGREYVAHDLAHGAAAARRRRQLAKRGLVGCAACGELTRLEHASIVRPAGPDADPNVQYLVCDSCIKAATGDVQ